MSRRRDRIDFDVTFPDIPKYGRAIQNYRAMRPSNVNGTTVHTRNLNEEDAIRGILVVANARYLLKEARKDYRQGSIHVHRIDTPVPVYQRLF